ncbi:MAG: xanthine dehydrogenase family protein subunit M [Azospirillaceae bacterium]
MYAFDYHKPSTLDEAKALLAGGEDPKLLAGGQTILPTMKQRLASPSDLVDLSGVAELKGIRDTGDALVIGAMTTHATVAADATVKAAIPALAGLASGIGDPQVRHRGTIGGSVANNDPAADYPAAVLALGATVKTTRREIAADDFFQSLFETALEEDEIILSIAFPKPKRAAYAKFDNPASRYAIVGVFVAETGSGVRVAVTGAGQEGVFRSAELETALGQSMTPEAAKAVKVSADGLNGDIHASPEYRAHLIPVMASRAVAALA